MKRHLLTALFVSGFMLCLTVAPALANDGPTISKFGALKPIEESVISMDRESVEFTVSENPGSSLPAKATFWFTNPTEKDVAVESIFPLTFEGPGSYGIPETYAENVRARVNGVAAKGEVKYADYPYRDSLKEGELEPKKAEGYVFPFKVPAKKTIKVEVDFDAPLSFVGHLSFNYYIGSGAGWSGPIKEAKFVVHYPYQLEKDWISTGSWYEGAGGFKEKEWAKESLQGKDYVLTLLPIEPDDGNSVINFEILPPSSAQMLIAAKKGMADFRYPWQWRQLADVYRSFEFGDDQFDSYRPQFAVDGYWMAIDKYLETEGISPFKPADYRQAVMLAEIYSDHWAPSNASGAPGSPQFSDVERYEKLMVPIRSQDKNGGWWGIDRVRMPQLLAFDAGWRGTKPQSGQTVQPTTIASSTYELGQAATAQASVAQLDQLRRDAEALRDEVKNLQQASSAPKPWARSIDPIVALLFVFGGVLAGFVTVALVKRSMAKK